MTPAADAGRRADAHAQEDDAGRADGGAAEPAADGGDALDAALDGAAPDDASAPEDASAPDAGPTLPATCDGVPGARARTWTLRVGARDRTARVHLPPGYDARAPMPVVLSFHGLGGTAQIQASYTGLATVADAEGFVLVHPQGVASSWNGGSCCGTASSSGVDDVGFVRALLDRLEDELCVDTARVYSTGMSNGGFMSHRLACELADRIAAIAPVAGVDATTACTPARPVPVLQIHGTADTIVPYSGAVRAVASWRERDGCEGPATTTFERPGARCERYGGCRGDAEVVLCTIDRGGHVWPGASSALDANRVLWGFLSRHHL